MWAGGADGNRRCDRNRQRRSVETEPGPRHAHVVTYDCCDSQPNPLAHALPTDGQPERAAADLHRSGRGDGNHSADTDPTADTSADGAIS